MARHPRLASPSRLWRMASAIKNTAAVRGCCCCHPRAAAAAYALLLRPVVGATDRSGAPVGDGGATSYCSTDRGCVGVSGGRGWVGREIGLE
uniref:Uncharacterized protein n=1 Tax=Solanum tuberosum TaxID=4113 RepID=M1DAK4_SOLTU